MSPWIGKFCFLLIRRRRVLIRQKKISKRVKKRKTSRLHVCLLILAVRNKIIPYNSRFPLVASSFELCCKLN